MSFSPFCRLYCPQHATQNFLLESCAVTVLIADVHASVELSQKFKNPNDSQALDAIYTFGLCADAAVCGFEMVRADGTKIEGVVKEKEEAKKEYQEAVKQGYTASLGSEETKDVFSISVGNIHPSEVVTINLRYLQTLKDDEKKDQVRFTFPRTYAQRYGQAPTVNVQRGFTVHQPFTLDAVVQQSGTIKSVSCPSGHPMELELGKPDGFIVDSSTSDSQFAKVTLRDSSGYLTQDITLVVTATGLDSPRCFIESHPSPDHDTVAMGLTFVPRFKLPDAKSGMEYIFLVDRSGSMDGGRIQLVREALVVLLRGLPTKGTTFNIFSFGSSSTKFWNSSQEYTQSNLDAATKHVDSMKADYGGTEIASALKSVYSSLPKPLLRPVSVFLLTDGSAWDVSTCVDRTREALSTQATNDNFIRVFTVGIGDGASTNTCDSIAKAGDGFSVFVGANEPVVGKCARLVRAARTPPVRNLEVFWTGAVENESDDDFEVIDDDDTATLTDAKPSKPKPAAPISLFGNDGDAATADVGPPPKPKVELPPPPKVQQAPLGIPSLFPGTRSQMYAIITNKQSSIPSSIKVKGMVVGTGAPVELDVPVTKMARPQQQNHAILHTLAAKALITDRENKIHAFPASISARFANNSELRDGCLEKEIVRLGTAYGLTSRHTSFVAVDRRSGQKLDKPQERDSLGSSVEFLKGILHTGNSSALMSYGGGLMSSQQQPQVYHHQMQQAMYAPMAFVAPATSSAFGGLGFPQPSASAFGSAPTGGSPASFASLSTGSSGGGGTFFGGASSRARSKRSQGKPPAPASTTQNFDPTVEDSSAGDLLDFSMEVAQPNSSPSPASSQDDDLFGQFNSAPPRPARVRAMMAPPPLQMAPPPPQMAALLPQALQPPPPGASAPPSRSAAPMSDGARLASIARLQGFDGGFSLREELLRLLEVKSSVNDFKQKCVGENLDEGVAATMLALLWLEKRGGDESLDLQEKASEWLGDVLGSEAQVALTKEKVLRLGFLGK